jgi:hypothetical protein
VLCPKWPRLLCPLLCKVGGIIINGTGTFYYGKFPCFIRHFILYCATCEKQIEPEPVVWFRRAHKWIYHLVCFKCEHCQRQLNTGEQFTLDDTVLRESQVFDTSIPRLLCKQHYMELVRGEQCLCVHLNMGQCKYPSKFDAPILQAAQKPRPNG